MTKRLLSDPESPDFCRLCYEPKRHRLTVSWHGYVTPQLAQQGAQAALDMLHHHSCPCLLNDNTELSGPWFDSSLWLAQQWVPAAAQAGLTCVAHVVRAGTLATTFPGTSAHKLFTEFEIQIFDSLAEADDWLSDHQNKLLENGLAGSPKRNSA